MPEVIKEASKKVEYTEQIKQLLTLPDYDKIDTGIELAVSLEEPKIFETLLDGCRSDLSTSPSYPVISVLTRSILDGLPSEVT